MHARHGGSVNGHFVVDQVIDWTGPTFEDAPTMRLGRKLQQRRFVLFWLPQLWPAPGGSPNSDYQGKSFLSAWSCIH